MHKKIETSFSVKSVTKKSKDFFVLVFSSSNIDKFIDPRKDKRHSLCRSAFEVEPSI